MENENFFYYQIVLTTERYESSSDYRNLTKIRAGSYIFNNYSPKAKYIMDNSEVKRLS